MDWTAYWALIAQILLAIVILTFPLAFFAFVISHFIERGSRRDETTKIQ